jgi:hypothetical protein
MNRSAPIRLLAITIAVLASGCNHQPTSKYPGELGAPCGGDSDCQNGMLCSTTHMPGDPLPFCFVPCSNADSECPEGSFCAASGVADTDGGPLRICFRSCETTDFCLDLNPEFNACATFGESHPICGFRG